MNTGRPELAIVGASWLFALLTGCTTGGSPTLIEDPESIAGCFTVTTVLLYSESTYELTLPGAFAANHDQCTRYYVDLPHPASDPTMPRGGVEHVHALGPNFHAMAEFSWSGWHDWIAQSPGTRDWELAGKTFRERMVSAGYDVAAGDTWVINEFPSSTRTGADDAWLHERSAVAALHDGDGTAKAKGVVFLAGMGESLANFADYKPNVATWLQQSEWWNAMSASVRWFSYEVYAEPHDSCVIGASVADDATHLNEYLEHVPRLAAEGGAATRAANDYLAHSFVPLVNAAWNKNGGFGDNVMVLSEFERFSRLQVYATHVWAQDHSYPGRRIGFAWSPGPSTADEQAELSTVIARSVSRAYPPQHFYGHANDACSVDGSLDGCGCSLSGAYNNGWKTFASW
jgi:hypothetical protein